MREISVSFYNYLKKNWVPCEKIWVHYHRREAINFGTHTNNHIEAFNRRIKRSIKYSYHLSETIIELMAILQQIDYKQNAYFLKEIKISFNRQVRFTLLIDEAESYISFHGIQIIRKKIALVKKIKYENIQYEIKVQQKDIYIVKGNTENSKYLVELQSTSKKAACDRLTYANF
jgi:hypothetical protein